MNFWEFSFSGEGLALSAPDARHIREFDPSGFLLLRGGIPADRGRVGRGGVIRLETLIELTFINSRFSILLLKLDKRLPVAQFEGTAPQSTVACPLLNHTQWNRSGTTWRDNKQTNLTQTEHTHKINNDNDYSKSYNKHTHEHMPNNTHKLNKGVAGS